MNRLALPLWALLALAIPSASVAGGLPGDPPHPAIAKKVWTSEEVEALRDRGLISLIGPQLPAQESDGEQPPPAPEAPAARVPRPIRAKDPEWYREQVAAFRSAIEVAHAEVRLVRRELGDARYWEGGINLRRENTGITPESALEILIARGRSELGNIDALGDQARRNDILPGALR